MSKFVNYNKRSVTLPAGCKDLIELLLPGRREAIHRILAADRGLNVTKDEWVIGSLAGIWSHVLAVLESRARMSSVSIQSPEDGQLSLTVLLMKGDRVSARVSFKKDAERERAVRAFFEHRGLQILEDQGMPRQFIPAQPVYLIYLINPVPPDAPDLAQLATDLFRECCGLQDKSELHFGHYQVADTA